ncbi:SpoIIE family protein phosphatase [Lentzea sp. CA-135723]|uniref:SpoIIE family protein phosphatase n=1 Tax=Lentzea sp. CA-135723 TaxID=3239950 RepID=UPI003D8A7DED
MELSSRQHGSDGDDPRASRTGSAEVFRDCVDQLSLMIGAYEGPEHVVVLANEMYRQFTQAAEPIGKPVREILPGFEAQQILALVERVFRSGKQESGREWRIQIGEDDDGAPQEVFLDMVLDPYFDGEGRIAGTVGYAIDVTDKVNQRRAAEQRTSEAQSRYERARDVVAELQAALLPTALPVLPQAKIAARYLIAAQDQAAGGDWFDAIALPDGTVALVVGDVVGHGVAASAAMGQLRAVLKHLLFTTDDLSAVLEQVNAFARREKALRACTLAVLRIDPRTGRFTYSLCGHPAPLVLHHDGSTSYLDDSTGGPLGVGRTPVVASGQLGENDLVLLYSDGLIERPNRTLVESAAELATVASDAAMNRVLPKGSADSATERVCQLTVELLTRSGYRDDVTTLAFQRLATPVAPLSAHFTATLEQLPLARRAIRHWLSEVDTGRGDHDALELVVGETFTNAVDHAYPDSPGPVHLTAELQPDGVCELRVADEGRWRDPVPGDHRRGHGLLLCEQLVDELTLTHPPQRAGEPEGARGTTVTVRHHLNRPAMLASATTSSPSGDGTTPYRSEVVADDRGQLIRVFGSVDAASGVAFERDLLKVSRGGTMPLTVDLAGITHLASSGVRVLFEVVDQLAAHRRKATLIAPAGGPAALVLDLVDLEHRS